VLADSSHKHLKIIFLNVHGGVQDEDRYLRLIDFVKWQDPDILGLVELDGWEKNNFDRLKDFLSKTHFVDGVFEEVNNGHPLAIFSKQKLAFRERLEAKMGLGLIHVKIDAHKESVDIYLTHLISKTADARTNELNQILNYIDKSEFTVLMGDFNSLSPNDPYDNEKLKEILRNSGITEFEIDKLKKDVITRLLDSGFKDAAEILDVPFKPTVPTSLSQDKLYPTELRLDYVFLRGKIVSYITRYNVIKTVETELLSDHYPVITEFEF
jgi:endonuclease/exonuclease/phosphatase family metal-dependent hydrolase